MDDYFGDYLTTTAYDPYANDYWDYTPNLTSDAGSTSSDSSDWWSFGSTAPDWAQGTVFEDYWGGDYTPQLANLGLGGVDKNYFASSDVPDWAKGTSFEDWWQDPNNFDSAAAEDKSLWGTITGAAKTFGNSAIQKVINAYKKPNSDETDWAKVAGTLGGLYGLYQAQNPNAGQPKVGYQGRIPTYTAVREAVPGAQYDATRRPGSGGQRYFTDTTYAAPSEVPAAREAATAQAAGLAALNRANPAQEVRSTATQEAVQRAKDAEGNTPRYAHGGITALAKGGVPRYLAGGTDGMADKIKANIDGEQEARLSHGEFVIPADVVSHLGNGNSDAGAERLYSMMDRIRKARTGTTQQGKQINPDKFMPS